MTFRQIFSAVILAAAALLLSAVPASAASYRYWAFWEGTGNGWTYQQSDPNTFVPADGSVDGWRFGVSSGSDDTAKPRTAPDFATACAHTPAVSGKKRVAVVIDYGTAADAGTGAVPPATVVRCVTLAADSSSAQLLAVSEPPLRYDASGMLCAISGYPQSGCGQVVSGSGTAAAASSSPGAAPVVIRGKGQKTVSWIIGAILIAGLGWLSFRRTRRRRD
ncbi:SCO2322 family protein [Streptacidiphilus sp. P02-A3a]|uniref:SCO2322 family protein n=1 Tax=Streptacidiphilus sp. P02-A3a TaxID=2704468 RepID=UPI0015F8813B|nr:SCO2322 family protein [Streptacidiphilus sp. P02-A3a]QMU68320.1 hypothetical protein GXP74_08835 [Streptacidiphilus sp. P02-A3a]